MRRLILLAALLSGCTASPDQPGAVTADEASQLNDAAAMLDANSLNAAREDADGVQGNTAD